MKITWEKTGKTYAAVIAAETSTETGSKKASHNVNKGKTNHNISQSLRIQGILEDTGKTKEKILFRQMPNWTVSWTQWESKRGSSSSKDLESLTRNGRNHERCLWRCQMNMKHAWRWQKVMNIGKCWNKKECLYYLLCRWKMLWRNSHSEKKGTPGRRGTSRKAENQQHGVI